MPKTTLWQSWHPPTGKTQIHAHLFQTCFPGSSSANIAFFFDLNVGLSSLFNNPIESFVKYVVSHEPVFNCHAKLTLRENVQSELSGFRFKSVAKYTFFKVLSAEHRKPLILKIGKTIDQDCSAKT